MILIYNIIQFTFILHTCRKHIFACQSAEAGTSPLSWSSGSTSLRTLFWAPLALSQVSWSPTNKVFRKVWHTTLPEVFLKHGTHFCSSSMMFAICHVTFSLLLITPSEAVTVFSLISWLYSWGMCQMTRFFCCVNCGQCCTKTLFEKRGNNRHMCTLAHVHACVCMHLHQSITSYLEMMTLHLNSTRSMSNCSGIMVSASILPLMKNGNSSDRPSRLIRSRTTMEWNICNDRV